MLETSIWNRAISHTMIKGASKHTVGASGEAKKLLSQLTVIT